MILSFHWTYFFNNIILSIKILKSNKWNYLSLYISYLTLFPIKKKLKSKEIQPINIKKKKLIFLENHRQTTKYVRASMLTTCVLNHSKYDWTICLPYIQSQIRLPQFYLMNGIHWWRLSTHQTRKHAHFEELASL
jgi:hypothetical protein